ncbi:MAG: M20 family metallopeptidase, partial [bacterium]|nr:M20 family metallopeptidase [bacterium]
MNTADLKSRVSGILDSLLPRLYQISDHIFQNPEIGYEEENASAWLTSFLEDNGFSVERGAGGISTAFKARASGIEAGPSIGIISEYDALPGLGHACGHNVIATMGIGAAAAVASLIHDLPGSVVSLGTPAEEAGGGKIRLVEAGVFKDVDAVMMVHPAEYTQISRPSLGRVTLTLNFIGKASHAATAPEKGINALDALVTAYQNIGLLRQQLPQDARIHGIITHGGEAPNVIPDRAVAQFSVQCLDKDYLPELVKRVKACAEGAAIAHGAKVEIEEGALSYAPVKHNRSLGKLFENNLRALGETPDPEDSTLIGGSTDLGNVSWIVPAIHPYLRMVPPNVPFHTKEFREAAGGKPGRKLLRLGAMAMAMTAIDLLSSPDDMKNVREEFAKEGNLSAVPSPETEPEEKHSEAKNEKKKN